MRIVVAALVVLMAACGAQPRNEDASTAATDEVAGAHTAEAGAGHGGVPASESGAGSGAGGAGGQGADDGSGAGGAGGQGADDGGGTGGVGGQGAGGGGGAGGSATATAGPPDVVDDPTPAPVAAPAWLTVRVSYPRYLQHMRRLNLETVNGSAAEIVVTAKALRADHFDPLEPELRRSRVGAGQQVDLQADFGAVADCDDRRPLAAAAELWYTTSDGTPHHVLAPVDPAPLDEIRARECAQRRVTDAVEVTVVAQASEGSGSNATATGIGPTAGEASAARVGAELRLVRRSGDDPVAIVSVRGSVIFSFGPDAGQGSIDTEPLLVLEPGSPEVALPVVFELARCDPHAISQSTKTFEFNLWVALDNLEPVRLAAPLDGEVRAALDAVIADCLATGGG